MRVAGDQHQIKDYRKRLRATATASRNFFDTIRLPRDRGFAQETIALKLALRRALG